LQVAQGSSAFALEVMAWDFGACSSGHPRLSQTTQNALGHPTTSVNDCFTGAVLSVTDANGTRTCTELDDLVREYSTAVMGSGISGEGITGAGVHDQACTPGSPATWVDYPPRGVNMPSNTIVHTKDGSGDGHYAKSYLDG